MAANVLSTAGSHTFKYTVTGGVTAGTLQIVGSTPMVPLETAAASAAGVTVTCQVGGAVLLPKKSAGTLAVGARAYYVTTGSPAVNKVTNTAAAGKLIGYVMASAATGATTVKVQLLTGPMPLETQA